MTATDHFGRPFRVGQQVLHVSRRSSQMYFERRIVVRVGDDGTPFIQMEPSKWNLTPEGPRKSMRPDRLVIYPEDNEGFASQAHAAMNTFCDRVERGEIRSRKTYAQFCGLLGRTPK